MISLWRLFKGLLCILVVFATAGVCHWLAKNLILDWIAGGFTILVCIGKFFETEGRGI